MERRAIRRASGGRLHGSVSGPLRRSYLMQATLPMIGGLDGKLMESLGPKLRRQRRRLGLTLDELSGRAGISKPYLSLIETGRVPNPPSDQKLRRLEQTLGFKPGELVSQAHLQRTPRDVRAMLGNLMKRTEDSG